MKSGKKFSRFIARALILFAGVSLTLVLGSLYAIFSRTMSQEFYHELRGQQVEISVALKDRLNELATDLRVMSLNNTVRVSLMLGVKSQLIELIKEQYPYSNGAFFWVREKEDSAFIPELPKSLWPLRVHFQELPQVEQLQIIKFQNFGDGEFLTLLAIPIRRKNDRLGTAYILHDLSQDLRFWVRMGAYPHGRLLIRDKGYLVDLRTGKNTPLPKGLQDLTAKRLELPWTDLSSEESLIPLKDFPRILYAASSAPLHKKKISLIFILSLLCSVVLLLTLLVSFFIGRRMSEPLENMADEALEIAQKPSSHFLNEEGIRYIEFRKLAQAFNHVLVSLQGAQEELKRWAKKELYASEERYRRTLEAAPDGIVLTTLKDGRFVEVNEAFSRMLGYSRKEAIGSTPFDMNLYVNPADRERLVKSLKEKGETNGIEIQYRRRDGAIVNTLLSARTIRLDQKDCLISVISDITDRKRVEEEKARLEKKLRQSQKMETIGTLAGGVVHDLNNILSGLVSYPELILMDLPEDSHLRKPILTIQKSGEKAAAIVQDLLTLARRGLTVREVVNLNHIVSEYLKSPEYEKLKSFHSEVQVETKLEASLLNIVGSPVHLSKTIMNLVSNAAEAMPGGGRIFISTENRYVDRPIMGYDDVEEGDYVVFSISDTGVGILSEDMERIFEPFYTKKVMGRSGTGLGMAVVWGTVKDHKGYIDVQSTEGKGTTFTIYFPVTRKALDKDKSLLTIEDYMSKGEVILVVDDVEEQRKIASRMLSKLGYSVTSVSSGEEAVDYMKNNSADLLVLDMIMAPGIDGLETYRRILELHPKQKAIIASGFSETDRVKEAQRLGAGAYVKKPYLIQKIGLAVRAEIDR